jgi:hypothetical protein
MRQVSKIIRRSGRALLLAGLFLGAVSAMGVARPSTSARDASAASQSNPCAPPILNPIVCENSRKGSPPAEWMMTGSGDPSIQGFATDISVDKGATISFKVNTTATAYSIVIYRMGYYGGLGARQVATITPSVLLPPSQPACLTDPTTLLYDCGNWAISASWTVPSVAVSGIYFAKLLRTDTHGFSLVVFVVRDDQSTSDLLFQTSDTTWQAYDASGGHSLYPLNGNAAAYKVSYNRPNGHAMIERNWVFGMEYPLVRWLEANGYNVSYFTGVDSDRLGSLIKQHKVFLSVGHDEYWSAGQRDNVEAARDAGVNLAFFSGNESYWKTRWESSIDGSNTPYRTLVCYKESNPGHPIDPLDPPIWTGTWRDNRFSPPADGGRPENAMSGNLPMTGADNFFALQVPAADGQMRFWRNTAPAQLPPGQVATIAAGCNCLIGFELDEDVDDGVRPTGLFHLSTTTMAVPNLIQDPFGVRMSPGVITHTFTEYRAASGALVFGAGTIEYPLALDGSSFYLASTPDPNVQQATVNLLADMQTQPGSLQPGLVLATASTDTIPPSSQITFPANGASLSAGYVVTIAGTSADAGGGVVGGVDVSTDGGLTWHPATGREQWSYTWSPSVLGSATIQSRAVDDSGNVETPSTGITVSVIAPSQTATATPTATTVVIPATNTPTSTLTATPTPTRPPKPTRTPSLTPTRGVKPTRTPSPTPATPGP